jgi:pyrrolidone-carboxylate peptidase
MPTHGMLTAFQPFMGREQNQSQLVSEQLVATGALPVACGHQLWPVDLAALAGRVEAVLAGPPLKYWLALGESGQKGVPLLETLAFNAFDLGDDPASAGAGPDCGILQPRAPATLVAHWPAAALAEHLLDLGQDVDLSCDAGRHCCNALLFEATYAALELSPRPWVGFLHLPRRPKQLDQQVELVAGTLAWLDQQFL